MKFDPKGKIGLGIITCNREDYFKRTLASVPYVGLRTILVVNDGKPYPQEAYDVYRGSDVRLIQHETNKGVAVSKNNAMRNLLELGCEHIFIMEDDMHVSDPRCFEKYINAAEQSGILHFNYGPGSPFNRKQTVQNFDLHNRHELSQDSEPNPKMVVNYSNNVSVALYEHTVAMFSYYHRSVLEAVGFIDEQFYNAWEHVDHTYQIHKAGFHPPFWWFADIADSDKVLQPQEGAIDNSSIADKGDKWLDNVKKGAELYKIKNGHYPAMTPPTDSYSVTEFLKKIKPKK